MKKAILLIFTALFSVGAFAIYNPNWERPIFAAHMKVRNTQGRLNTIENVELTLTRRDGQKNPTGLILKYQLSVGPELPAFKTIQETLQITNISQDACGSLLYTAEVADSDENESATDHSLTLTLMDNNSRVCEDLRPGKWEATLSEDDGLESTARFVGNPEGVITIQ